jgi:hypothetical protein
VNRGDQPAPAEDLHGTADGAVGDRVVLGQVALGAQPCSRLQFIGGDPRGDVLRDAHVGQVSVASAGRLKIAHSSNIAARDLPK